MSTLEMSHYKAIYKSMDTLLLYYTVFHKKTWQYTCDHNSGKTRLIFYFMTYFYAPISTIVSGVL